MCLYGYMLYVSYINIEKIKIWDLENLEAKFNKDDN